MVFIVIKVSLIKLMTDISIVKSYSKDLIRFHQFCLYSILLISRVVHEF